MTLNGAGALTKEDDCPAAPINDAKWLPQVCINTDNICKKQGNLSIPPKITTAKSIRARPKEPANFLMNANIFCDIYKCWARWG